MVTGSESSRNRYRRMKDFYREYQKKYHESDRYKTKVPQQTKDLKTRRGTNQNTCFILKQHHESMKSDPEHLTTGFLKKLINVDCKDLGDD